VTAQPVAVRGDPRSRLAALEGLIDLDVAGALEAAFDALSGVRRAGDGDDD